MDGLLLAGGRSSRFGGDKRRAVLGGRTLAERSLALLRARCANVFVAGRGAFDHDVRAVFVADEKAGAGPLGGLAAGLARSRDGVLVLPCDAPLVSADTLEALARAGRRRGRAVVLRSARGVEPLVAFYPRSALPVLRAALREGNMALHRLLPRLRAIELRIGAAREVLNVNRRGDLDEVARVAARGVR